MQFSVIYLNYKTQNSSPAPISLQTEGSPRDFPYDKYKVNF